jgi:hypothetical protein
MTGWQMVFLAMLIGVALGLCFRVWVVAVVGTAGFVAGFCASQLMNATMVSSILHGVAVLFAVEIGYLIGAILMMPRRRQPHSTGWAGHSDHSA